MQENEPAVSDPVPEAAPPGHPQKKKGLGELIRTMWPAYLIEIFVIILGISITLAMEEWRDKSRESELEKVYLRNLDTDLLADQKSLRYVILRTEKLIESGNQLLIPGRTSSGNIDYRSVNAGIDAILSRPKFISSDATFSDLKSSGNLHLIQGIRLKNLMFSYYNLTQIIRENQDAEQLATINLSGAYFLRHFSLDDSARLAVIYEQAAINDLVRSVEFQNNVLLRVSNRTELLNIYQMADSTGGLLRSALVSELE